MFTIAVHTPVQHRQFRHSESTLRIGRIESEDATSATSEIGQLDLAGISLEIEMTLDGQPTPRAQILNHGKSVELPWQEDNLPNGISTTIALPFLVRAGDIVIEVRGPQDPTCYRSARTISSSRNQDGAPRIPTTLLGESPGAATLARWFETLGLLQRKAAESKELLIKALEAIISPGGLDSCMLLVKGSNGQWQIKASHVPHPTLGIAFIDELLEPVEREQLTVFHEQPTDADNPSDSVVAAPIVGPDNQIEAILYGVRSIHGNNQRRLIRPLEAIWVQLVAEAISGGMIRLQAEANAARTRVLFEQAFSGKVVRELVDNPHILHGQELEVTVLFADLREFSGISERLGTRDTYSFLGDLLEHLTDCVMNEGGVVIDYYGDGLAAMWNAPTSQADHAERACRAALNMQYGLPKVSQQWNERLKSDLNIGIGINTGVAQVGNAGTVRRMKYGPRGTTVNIASRVETATKLVDTPILITSSTLEQIADTALAPRIGRAKLKGISEPVELFQLLSLNSDKLARIIFDRIELQQKVLALFEEGNIEGATALLDNAEALVQQDHSNERLCDKFLYEYLASADRDELQPVFDLTGGRK